MGNNNSSPFFKGQVLNRLKCQDVTNLGYGVFKKNNYTIFVPSTFETEIADIKIIEVKKKYAIGEVVKLHSESKYRISKSCLVEKKCNGARYRDISYEYQIKIKEKQLSKLFSQEIQVEKSETQFNYRNKSEFVYQNNRLNMYTDKNNLEPIETCILAHPRINEVLSPLLESLNNNKKAEISNVVIRYSEYENKIMIILVSKVSNKYQHKIAQEIVGFNDLVDSVILNKGDSINYLFNEEEQLLYGKDYILDTLLDKEFKISSKSFYQVNKKQAEKLYKIALEFADVTIEDNIADLYCGVGTIGIIMSDYVNHVLGVEIVKEAVDAAKENVLLNEASNVEIVEHDLTKDFSILKGIDVAIVDPPRSGLSRNIISNISKSKIPKIVYISCDPYTQKRDIDQLINEGYKLDKIRGVDMFVNTHHVESVALLSKKEI